MKRIWFAVIFLSLAAALCITEQNFIKTFHEEMDKKITAAEAAAEGGDKKKLDAEITEIKYFWKEHNDLLFTLSNHALPDELGARIRALRPENANAVEELEGIKAMNDVFYEDQRITFANIF